MGVETRVEQNATSIEKLMQMVTQVQEELRQSAVADEGSSDAAKAWASEWYEAGSTALEPEYTDEAKLLGERITLALRAFAQRYESGERTTAILRGLARDFVALRAQFRDDDGATDWRGRTWDYRRFVGDLYDASGVDPEVRYKLQTGLRYHVSNELRKQVPKQELESVGLIPTSARLRQGEARKLQADLVADLKGRDALTNLNPSAPRSWEISTTAVRRSVHRLSTLDPVNLSDQQREMMTASINEQIDGLRRVLTVLKPSSAG